MIWKRHKPAGLSQLDQEKNIDEQLIFVLALCKSNAKLLVQQQLLENLRIQKSQSMRRTKVNAITIIIKSSVYGFRWSFKPILIVMNILGIRLDFSNKIPFYSRLLSFFLFCVFLSSMLTISYKTLSLGIMEDNITAKEIQKLDSKDQKQLLLLSIFIFFSDAVNFFLWYGSYLILTVFSLNGEWKMLWCTLIKIQTEIRLRKEFHQQIRRSCYIGCSVFLLVSTTFINLAHPSII